MTPTQYLKDVTAQLTLSPIIRSSLITKSWAREKAGYLHLRLTLINGDFVEIGEYFLMKNGECITEDYRYQWMNGKKTKLRKRWDNTRHFPDLDNFPHHIHLANGRVISGTLLSTLQVLQILQTEIKIERIK